MYSDIIGTFMRRIFHIENWVRGEVSEARSPGGHKWSKRRSERAGRLPRKAWVLKRVNITGPHLCASFPPGQYAFDLIISWFLFLQDELLDVCRVCLCWPPLVWASLLNHLCWVAHNYVFLGALYTHCLDVGFTRHNCNASRVNK